MGGAAWQEVVPILTANDDCEQLEPPGSLPVLLSTVWLYTHVKPGILLAGLESDNI